MLKLTSTRIRKNINVSFTGNNDTDEYKKYFYSNFVKTNKFISSKNTVSDDGLTLVSESVWNSEDDYLDFITDAYCFITVIDPVKEYNIKNEIKLQVAAEKI